MRTTRPVNKFWGWLLPVTLLGNASWPMPAEAQQLRNLTNSPASESAVAWGPDSRRLLVSSDRSGVFDIYLISLTDPAFGDPVIESPGDDFVGGWSADGRITFVSSRDGNPEIYVASSLGGEVENVSRDSADDWLPSWGWDGRLVYNTYRFGGSSEIVVVDGSDSLVRLTDNELYDAGAELSPDGAWVLYHSRRDDNYDLYLRRIADGAERRLTTDPADDSYGSWSPAGDRIAFRSDRDGNDEIYILTVASGDLARLTSLPASVENYPAWSPDGRYIAFVSDRDGNNEIYVIEVE